MRSRSMLVLITLLATVCLAMPSLTMAQTTRPARGGGRRGELLQRVRGVLDDLKLSDEQKAKVDEAINQARQDLRDLMQTVRDLPPQERRQKMRDFAMSVREKIAGLLTDEQRVTFRQKMEELREQVAGGGGGGGGRVQASNGPGAGPGGAGGPRGDEPGPVVRRLREAMTMLDLSADQKQKVDAVLNDVQDKARELRREAQGDAQALREKGRQLIRDSRAKLQEILSPDQQSKLRELMQQGRGRGNDQNAPATSPTTNPSDKAGEKSGGGSGGGGSGGGGAMAPPMQPTNERLAVGQPAPAFRVTKLDGLAVQLDSFQGKIALIAFGSYSSPSFRQRILSLEDLRREYGSRVSFLIIYTREAHPSVQWEVDRNREQQISIADAKDLSQRKELAKQARTKLKINIPLAVDTMDDDAAKGYHAWPNDAAVLIDKDGTVLAYQQWFDAYGMKQAILEALSNKPRVQPTSAPTTEPQVK